MKYIKLSNDQKGSLRKAFNVSQVCIWKALCYKSDSGLSEKIRSAALEMGGRVIHELDVTDGFMPNCCTDFEHGSDGVRRLVMSYPNGIRLEIDAAAGCATLIVDGEAVRRYWNVTADNLYTVAFEAQQLSGATEIGIAAEECAALPA